MPHHHDDRWDRGWRRFEQMARRWGSSIDGLGGNFKIGRMLASGDVRLVALYLIEQQPRHGYDLIKAIEERSEGFYSPSPGIVYPALTFLEEAGYVTSSAEGNKKLYTITDEGRAHLADNRDAIHSTLDFLAKAGAKMKEFREMGSDGWQFATGEAGDPREPGGEGWPGGRREHFRGDGPRRHGPGHGPGPGRGPRPDRDMRDVLPEVNEGRRELKTALGEVSRLPLDRQQRVAEILRKAAGEIRQAAEQPGDDIDL